jgi:hypothetical protein
VKLFKVCKCGRIEELSQHINGGEKPKMQLHSTPKRTRQSRARLNVLEREF